MTIHYLMISIIKGKSPTVLFSLALTCHSKKKNYNIFNINNIF